MINSSMSAEKIISKKVNDLPPLTFYENSKAVLSSRRVDINILLNRARKAQKQETITNLVFVGLAVTLILIVGLILSF